MCWKFISALKGLMERREFSIKVAKHHHHSAISFITSLATVRAYLAK